MQKGAIQVGASMVCPQYAVLLLLLLAQPYHSKARTVHPEPQHGRYLEGQSSGVFIILPARVCFPVDIPAIWLHGSLTYTHMQEHHQRMALGVATCPLRKQAYTTSIMQFSMNM
jgi:hypothetical protein